MGKPEIFVMKCAMFLLLGVLLSTANITPLMWQFHAITLWGIVMANMGGKKDG